MLASVPDLFVATSCKLTAKCLRNENNKNTVKAPFSSGGDFKPQGLKRDGDKLGIQGEKLALYPLRVMVTSSRGEDDAVRHKRAFTIFTITTEALTN